MYVIQTTNGLSVGIIGVHVAAIEQDSVGLATVLMIDGTRYPTTMPASTVMQAVMELRSNEIAR